MEKQEMLRDSIKKNQFISESFKCNIGTLTDTLASILPDYDYSFYETALSTLKIEKDFSLEEYSSYNKGNNELKLNLDKAFEDGIDLQHLFLSELLKMNKDENAKGFNNGMSEAIASLMNNDESMKKLYPLEYLGVSLLSKIVEPGVLIDGYMNNDMASIMVDLESKGIEPEEFKGFVQKFDTIDESFGDIEIIATNMFAKKIITKLSDGAITYDDISPEFNMFEDMLITKRSELNVLYPHHSFDKLDLKNVKPNLDLAMTNVEDMSFVDINTQVK